MHEVVWRDGERPVKSFKKDRELQKSSDKSTAETNPAILTALELDSHIRESLCTRDVVNNKLTERHLIGRATSNPFFTENTYIDDLVVETNYLRPRNTKE